MRVGASRASKITVMGVDGVFTVFVESRNLHITNGIAKLAVRENEFTPRMSHLRPIMVNLRSADNKGT